MPTYILGITAYGRNSAAALICDGHIVAAAQEERFSRISNDCAFPANALQYCLAEAGIDGERIDIVAVNVPRDADFHKLADAAMPALSKILKLFAVNPPVFLQKILLAKEMKKALGDCGWLEKLSLVALDFSHAASAFFPSPYQEALVLTVEGRGEDGAPQIVAAATGENNYLVDIEFDAPEDALTLAARTGRKNLCVAGNAAADWLAYTSGLTGDGAFENIWVQPAAGDAGAALGAALKVWYRESRGYWRRISVMRCRGAISDLHSRSRKLSGGLLLSVPVSGLRMIMS